MVACLPHPRRLLLFLALSLGDLLLTCWLLGVSGGRVYEGNPVARWLLDNHGWAGLVAFKAAVVALFSGLAVLISVRHRRRGGQVLSFACATVAGVLVYSGILAGVVRAGPGNAELARYEEQARRLDMRIRASRNYQALLRQVSQDLIDGRCTLGAAVASLAGTEKARDRLWLHQLRGAYAGRTDRECLAASLILYSAASVPDPADADRLTRRLRADFRATFGVQVPSAVRHMAATGKGPGPTLSRPQPLPGLSPLIAAG